MLIIKNIIKGEDISKISITNIMKYQSKDFGIDYK